jgi:hypothetical protein
MRQLTLILCLAIAGVAGCKKKQPIDATSMETLHRSLEEARKTSSNEDIAIVTTIIREAGYGLDLSDPKSMEIVLGRVRPRLQGKTVNAVASEVRAADGQLLHKADEFVRERQERWIKRAQSVNLIKVGVKRDKVIELLGEPDFKSDSPTVENWLYNYDAGHDKEQIWIDATIIQITDGVVSSVRPGPTRMGIKQMLETAK